MLSLRNSNYVDPPINLRSLGQARRYLPSSVRNHLAVTQLEGCGCHTASSGNLGCCLCVAPPTAIVT